MTACRLTAGSPTPPSADANDRPPTADGMASTPVVAVGYSGGRDSTALLHATLAAAAAQGLRVLALHVHHGLQPNADAWLAHCESECRRWQAQGKPVAFASHRVAGRPAAGQSTEAWAREVRHVALRTLALAHGASLVLLAHHRQDQAETWLLQALRGGGVAGLAAMPARAERGGICWARPWLHRPRADLEAYVCRHRLSHIEDDSNHDPRFARNRLRLQAWTALGAAFPGAEASLAQSAAWAQEATAALAELAEIDLATVVEPHGLVLDRWRSLSTARRSNCLRGWLKRHCGAPVTASLTGRLMNELILVQTGRWIVDEVGELRLYRGVLRWVCAASGASVRSLPLIAPWPSTLKEDVLSIRQPGSYPLAAWGGSLQVRLVREGGVPLAWLAHLELRARRGGERFQAGPGRPARSLKKQFQDAGVARWDRDGPLIFSGGQLVYVPGLGIDARVIGPPGQPAVALQWQAGAIVGLAPSDG